MDKQGGQGGTVVFVELPVSDPRAVGHHMPRDAARASLRVIGRISGTLSIRDLLCLVRSCGLVGSPEQMRREAPAEIPAW